MAKEELMEFSGTVLELLPNAMFRVVLDNEHEASRHLRRAKPFDINFYKTA